MKLTKQVHGCRPRAWAGLLGALLVLGGCASGPNRAPVEDRKPAPRAGASAAAAPATAPAVAADPAKPLPGAENAGKPGYYSVKPGDTLIRIALDHGQNWRDLQRWNGLDNPNVIEVGQVLRVAPPVVETAGANNTAAAGAAVARPVQPAGRVESRPLESRPGASAPGAASPAASTAASPVAGAVASAPGVTTAAAAPAATPAAAPAKPAAREGDDDVPWMWPAAGPVVAPFDESRSKGVAIGGKAGDPVLAAADGRVVYAGSGLRGYGNLVIVKHNATYLTAYAHNQSLLVKDEQVVRRGQKIAEMGSSDAERVQLHFEIRRLGVPIDPLRLLPPR